MMIYIRSNPPEATSNQVPVFGTLYENMVAYYIEGVNGEEGEHNTRCETEHHHRPYDM
jgi:hypothetical protein